MSAECTDGPGLSGWLNMPPPDDIWCGCGIVYDCCGVIVPAGCLAGKCMLWREPEKAGERGGCKVGPKTTDIPPMPPEYFYLHEFLFRRDLDGNGMIYGFDFILDNPPPVLSEIPYVGKVEE